MHRSACLILVTLLTCACALTTPQASVPRVDPFTPAVVALGFEELLPTFSTAQIDAALQGQLSNLPDSQRRAAATLVSMGAIDAADLATPALIARKLEDYAAVMAQNHPALLGRTGDSALLARLSEPLDYQRLLSASEVLRVLGGALSDGVITGYDLRQEGVYDGFPNGHTLIYSQSDLRHMRQLVTLLEREGVDAWVYLTPKISAFLYREEWGNGGAHVVTLPGGTRVVQGREMAVLFRFATPEDRLRFHEVVTLFAKRDSKTEEGLIASAWWQPFYYTDAPLPDFQPISLVVIAANGFEATLTVLKGRAQSVIDAVQHSAWNLREEEVWVNPSFYRFLTGDYK